MTTEFDELVQHVHDKLTPDLPVKDCKAWALYTLRNPDTYYWARVGQAGMIVKVYNQPDPPWKRVAQEICWWGPKRDAVRSLHRGMDWARLQGAELFGYSLYPNIDTM